MNKKHSITNTYKSGGFGGAFSENLQRAISAIFAKFETNSMEPADRVVMIPNRKAAAGRGRPPVRVQFLAGV